MTANRWSLFGAAALLVAAAGGAAPIPSPPQRPRPVVLDIGKGAIERPLERLVATAAPTPARAVAPLVTVAPNPAVDQGKGKIERPLKLALTRATQPLAAAAGTTFANPRVEPGKVKWHPTLETACAASKKSGKPVLVFHLMGRLDDRFC